MSSSRIKISSSSWNLELVQTVISFKSLLAIFTKHSVTLYTFPVGLKLFFLFSFFLRRAQIIWRKEQIELPTRILSSVNGNDFLSDKESHSVQGLVILTIMTICYYAPIGTY